MIVLSCTNCRARLQIDDAFAGGVCRCMYCGTIQTVPSHLKAAQEKPKASGKPVKALYTTNPRGDGSGSPSGLEDLATAVSSSGLTSDRLRAETLTPDPGVWRRKLLLAIGAGGAMLLCILLWVTLSGSDDSPAAPGAVAEASTGQSDGPNPSFCGVSLSERTVVYVLDRGSATGEMFGDLREACYRSIESLGPERKFQIILWSDGTTPVSFPRSGPTFANSANLAAARRALDEVNAHGQTNPTAALAQAFEARPEAIVLATAKAFELDDAFIRSVSSARKDCTARIYGFALGAGDPGAALKTIARQSGGQFRAINASELRDYRE
jgi:hypothetical protein